MLQNFFQSFKTLTPTELLIEQYLKYARDSEIDKVDFLYWLFNTHSYDTKDIVFYVSKDVFFIYTPYYFKKDISINQYLWNNIKETKKNIEEKVLEAFFSNDYINTSICDWQNLRAVSFSKSPTKEKKKIVFYNNWKWVEFSDPKMTEALFSIFENKITDEVSLLEKQWDLHLDSMINLAFKNKSDEDYKTLMELLKISPLDKNLKKSFEKVERIEELYSQLKKINSELSDLLDSQK